MKILMSSATDVCPSRMTATVRNGGRKTAFSDTQSCSFFDPTKLPTVAQWRTSVTGRNIFLTTLAKARLVLMDNTAGYSRDPVKEKVVTVPPKDFSHQAFV